MEVQGVDGSKLKIALAADARRIHEIMCVAAIIIFPIFAFFDRFTLPAEIYWGVTILRLSITAAIAVWLFVQKRYHTNEIYLAYFTFIGISWFCAYVCAIGGKPILFQNNIAYCTVFLAASLFMLWHWKHSVIMVISSIFVYVISVVYAGDVSLVEVLFTGGAVLLTIVVLHPVIVAFRYNAYIREFYLKEELKISNALLKKENEATEHRNHELMQAREAVQLANGKLTHVNLFLEQLVEKRTLGLEKANARMRAVMAELDLFLYSSYHDLKSPIARMKGLLDLLRHEESGEHTAEYHDLLLVTLDDMEDLIEKLNLINTFTNHDLKKETVSPQLVIEEVLQLLKPFIQGAEIEVNISASENMHTDKTLLHSMLKCLVENALTYRREEVKHQVKISVSSGDKFELAVWDNGIGIGESILPNIFEMYYRGTEKSKGHGLGLFITKKALDKLNGSIFIESKPGEYTEFKMSL